MDDSLKKQLSKDETGLATYEYIANKIESIEGDRDVVDKALRTYMTMIYFYGYKEQIFIGSFDKQLFHTLSSKLKK